MKIVLKQSVANFGVKGEVKEVKDGYAVNWLLPNNFAVCYGTDEAKEILKEKATQKAERAEKPKEPIVKVKKSAKRVQEKIKKDDKKLNKIKVKN